MTEERITLNDWLGLALDAKRRLLELHPDATVYVEIGADDDGLPGLPRFFAQGESIHEAVAEATVELSKHSANFNGGTRIEDNVHDFSCTPRDPKEGDTIALGQVAEFKRRARLSRRSLERARKAFAAGEAEVLKSILQGSTGIGQPPLVVPDGWQGTQALDQARGQARALRREFGAEKTWPFPWEGDSPAEDRPAVVSGADHMRDRIEERTSELASLPSRYLEQAAVLDKKFDPELGDDILLDMAASFGAGLLVAARQWLSTMYAELLKDYKEPDARQLLLNFVITRSVTLCMVRMPEKATRSGQTPEEKEAKS